MPKNKFKFIFLLILLLLLWYLGRKFPLDSYPLEEYLKKTPLFLSGVVFVVLYITVTFFLWLSKDIFRFLAALLFGAYYSTLFVFIAECANAVILFNLARYLGSDFVEGSLKGKKGNWPERLSKVNFLWLFLFRAVPLLPFRFLDLACGITRMSFKRYMLAVILGSPLRIFWLQYILSGVGKSIFSKPDALMIYLMSHKPVLIFSILYIFLVVVVAVRLKLKD
jgi:uncharacterized membrane protein YdjX (TVP38/TMEM64 family)